MKKLMKLVFGASLAVFTLGSCKENRAETEVETTTETTEMEMETATDTVTVVNDTNVSGTMEQVP